MTPLLASLLWLALTALVTAGLWWLGRRTPQVSVTRTLPPTAFEGTRSSLTVQVTVRSRRPLRLVMEDPAPRGVVPDRLVSVSALHLGVTERTETLSVTFNRRGQFDWPGVELAWADPLGLFWRRVTLPGPGTTVAVYPGTHGLLLPDLLRPLLSEGTLARQLGLDDPISLRGVRPYVPGDPPGRVHWRLSARTGTLTVREPERTAASSLTVFVDTSAGGDVFVDSAARLAASLIREAQALTLPVAVATNGAVTPAGRDVTALHEALLTLARLTPSLDPPQLPPTRAGGNLILLSARPSPGLVEQALRARAAASRVSIVALPEGYYLEPGEQPRRQWTGVPDSVRDLERRAAVLASAGILVFVLRGNQSVLTLAR